MSPGSKLCSSSICLSIVSSSDCKHCLFLSIAVKSVDTLSSKCGFFWSFVAKHFGFMRASGVLLFCSTSHGQMCVSLNLLWGSACSFMVLCLAATVLYILCILHDMAAKICTRTHTHIHVWIDTHTYTQIIHNVSRDLPGTFLSSDRTRNHTVEIPWNQRLQLAYFHFARNLTPQKPSCWLAIYLLTRKTGRELHCQCCKTAWVKMRTSIRKSILHIVDYFYSVKTIILGIKKENLTLLCFCYYLKLLSHSFSTQFRHRLVILSCTVWVNRSFDWLPVELVRAVSPTLYNRGSFFQLAHLV